MQLRDYCLIANALKVWLCVLFDCGGRWNVQLAVIGARAAKARFVRMAAVRQIGSNDRSEPKAVVYQTMKTQCYWKTITYPAAPNDRSVPSSLTQQPSLPREPRESDTSGRLSWPRCENPEDERGDQDADNPITVVAAPSRCRLNFNRNRTRASVTIQPVFSKKL